MRCAVGESGHYDVGQIRAVPGRVMRRYRRTWGERAADGSLSPILQKRVDAAIDLYFRGVAPIVVMSGDGRESNYDEPNAMKAYAIAQGVPESAIYCDGGGYHTYDTMWRVANVYGAQSVAIVTQKYHQYRAVFDGARRGYVSRWRGERYGHL